MHPINHNNFGATGIQVSFYNGTSVVNGYITRQLGTNKFIVSDGTTLKTVTLAPTLTIAQNLSTNPTYCTILVTPANSATGATFTVNYGIDTAVAAAGGTGWVVNDTLSVNGITGSVLTVSSVSSGAITGLTVTNPGTSGITTLLTNPVATTKISSTSGANATVNLKYKVLTITASGGSGYAVNDTLNFNGIVATTTPQAHITTAPGGAATGVGIDVVGAGITTAATSVSVNAPAEHILHIYASKVVTIEGKSYNWKLGSSVNGSAFITRF